ncbi:ABC transporter permease [Roseomonas sp. E05]|uniref:ABC transporter permease n=1 Tax=Roseomonas sp. E05 TaxID=3046310 RepID=UPI0024BBA83F|nr:ABC transporter permease [Roseomonas sp. E05]MDJ0388822.1 ABC transporter permease [Roseomonas sp. E05]
MAAVTAHGAPTLPRSSAWLLLTPALAMFILFFAVPFLTMATMSVLSGNPMVVPNPRFTTRHFERILDDVYYLETLWITVRLGLSTTIVSLLIGYPLALWLARARSRTTRTLLMMAVLAPMMMGLVVRTYAWLAMYSNRGVINGSLAWLGLTDEPIQFLGSEAAVVVALAHIYVPFMILTLSGVIARIDTRLEEAARGLGASSAAAFLQVTLPLSMPGILAGSLLVFALAISAYVTPIVIGNYNIQTLPMLVYQQISSSFNLGFAAALGIVLLIVALLLVGAYNRVMARAPGAA